MKATFLSGLALVCASFSGTLTFGWLATGDARLFWADLACALAAFALQIAALNSARGALRRAMLRDLRGLEALLDDRASPHVCVGGMFMEASDHV